MLPHFGVSLSLVFSRKNIIWVACFICLVAVYFLKPATSDLPKYSVYFDTGLIATTAYKIENQKVILDPVDTTGDRFFQAWPNNPGFVMLSRVLNSIFYTGPLYPRIIVSSKRFVSDLPITVLMFLGFASLMYPCFWAARSSGHQGGARALVLPIATMIVGSVFFLIGSQNAIRQFLGIAFLLSGFAFVQQKFYLRGAISGVLAISMHQWVIVFAVILFLIRGVLKGIKLSNQRWAIPQAMAAGFVIGCGFLLTIKGILLGQGSGLLGLFGLLDYLSGNTGYLSELTHYVRMDTSGHLERSSGYQKVVAVGLVVLMSEIIAGLRTAEVSQEVRLIRIACFAFALPLVIYPEILSRYLFFYFGVEVLFLSWAVNSSVKRHQIAGLLVFSVYAFAPNAINILLGAGWFYSLS